MATTDVQDLAHAFRSVAKASMIAFDAPCRWSSDGRARPCNRELMLEAGIDLAALTSNDWIDAALCALTARIVAGGGACVAYGEPQTGWIVVPSQPNHNMPMALA